MKTSSLNGLFFVLTLALSNVIACADNTTPVLGGSTAVGASPDTPLCEQNGGQMYARGEHCGSTRESACTTDGMCVSQDSGAYGHKSGALIALDSSDDLNKNAAGNCGPVGLWYCSNSTLDGVPYAGLWFCSVSKGADGKLVLKAMPKPCAADQVCKIDLARSAPNYGWCGPKDECAVDGDCKADDGNACTKNTCQGGKCMDVPLANGTSCADADMCNGAETCVDSKCTSGSPVVCVNTNPCLTTKCDPLDGACSFPAVPNGTSCADANLCNGAETCVDGTCTPGTSVTCDDGKSCNGLEACGLDGKCVPGDNAQASTQCDDGNPCTGPDACDGNGTCASTTKNCADDDVCTADSCDAAGICQHTTMPESSACGENMVCVNTKSCQSVDDTCGTSGAKACRIINGKEGAYTCMVAEGSTLGVWSLQTECLIACADGVCL